MASLLLACNRFGSGRVKNIVELSQPLKVEVNKTVKFAANSAKKLSINGLRNHSHRIATAEIIAQPVMAKNIIYVLDKRAYVSAYSLKEQKLLWRTDSAAHNLDRITSKGGILYSNGKLYISNGSRHLVILDAATGDELMRKEYPDILKTKPVITANQLLIAQTISNQLIAYNLKESKFTWIQEGGEEIISTSNQVAPTLYNDSILASYSSGEIVYLDAQEGKVKWRYNLIESYNVGTPGFEPAVIVTPPIIQGDYAYFATSNNKLVKIDLNNGAPVWQKEAEAIQTMELVGDYLLITNNARQVAIIDEHNGQVNWVGELISSKEKKYVTIPPILTQKPFISQENGQFIINIVASNGELYRFRVGTEINAQPAISKIANNVRYINLSCCGAGLYLITGQYIKY